MKYKRVDGIAKIDAKHECRSCEVRKGDAGVLCVGRGRGGRGVGRGRRASHVEATRGTRAGQAVPGPVGESGPGGEPDTAAMRDVCARAAADVSSPACLENVSPPPCPASGSRAPCLASVPRPSEAPHRVTPDGTAVYYWCDVPRQDLSGTPRTPTHSHYSLHYDCADWDKFCYARDSFIV